MYEKPWLSYPEQLEKLKSRGLAVTDEPKALEYLDRIGYYRLSGYWFPLRERSGLFCPIGKGIRKGKKTKDAIAEKYGIRNGRTLASWLRSLNYLRNVCTHHSRLWNRNVIDQP